MRRKWLRIAAGVSLLLLTLVSGGCVYLDPYEALREETEEDAELATMEAWYDAIEATRSVEEATKQAPAMATWHAEVAGTYDAEVAAEATRTSEERASTEPALEITKMATEVLSQDAEAGVANIDFIFTVKYVTGGHTACLVCYEENVESEETPVSGESGTSEVIVHLVDYDYFGPGETEPFCELRDAESGEVLTEAYPGPHTIYGD